MGEFCLMRGVDDACLLSMASAPEGRCVIKLCVDGQPLALACSVDQLEGLAPGSVVHLAGPDALCAMERDGKAVRLRLLPSEGRARTFEIEPVRFDAAMVLLASGRHADVLGSLN